MRHWKRLLAVVAIFFIILGGLVGAAVVANYKHIGTLVRVVQLIRTEYIEDVTSDQLMEGAIAGMVNSLDDPYSVYMDSDMFKDLKIQVEGKFGGIGVHITKVDGLITVISPIKGTPAYRAGLKTGDVITRVGKTTLLDVSTDKAADLLRGEPGTKVKLQIMRKDEEEPLEIEITREIINVPSVDGEIIEGNIAYIQLTVFDHKTFTELKETLTNLNEKGFDGIILDLRNNPGGALDTCTQIADLFVPEGDIVKIVYKDGSEEVYSADKDWLDVPVAVLVNGGSASASEILAGAIKDHKSGVLIGTKTFGKGVVQTIYPLEAETGLKLTTAKYLTPKGHDINKKGIKPNIEVKEAEDQLIRPEKDKDVQLQRAIQEVKEMLAKAKR